MDSLDRGGVGPVWDHGQLHLPAVRSPMYDGHRARLTPEQLERHDARMAEIIHIGGKLGDAYRDLAPMIVFLCGDGAHYITGQTISIDGGAVKVR